MLACLGHIGTQTPTPADEPSPATSPEAAPLGTGMSLPLQSFTLVRTMARPACSCDVQCAFAKISFPAPCIGSLISSTNPSYPKQVVILTLKSCGQLAGVSISLCLAWGDAVLHPQLIYPKSLHPDLPPFHHSAQVDVCLGQV